MDESNTHLFPLVVQWDLGPEKLKDLKNKLLVYFSSKSRSNGGDCVIKDPNCSHGNVLIHFNQETVRDQVLLKPTHEIILACGKALKLNISLPERGNPNIIADHEAKEMSSKDPKAKEVHLKETKVNWTAVKESPVKEVIQQGTGSAASTKTSSEAGDVPSESFSSHHVILIENVKDNCKAEMLQLLLERLVTGDHDFQVEMIHEIGSALVTFTHDIDIPSLMETFSSDYRVKKMNLKATALEETQSIRVEGLPPDLSDNYLTLYFENSRHGGGEVVEVKLIPEEEAAIVTFTNTQDTKRVLGKEHVFGKKPISVFPYYVSKGLTLYGTNAPRIKLPKPLEVPISPYVLEFILGDLQIKDNIDKKMADKSCEITWPDPNCSHPTIKLFIPSSISSHPRTMAKIGPTWRHGVSKEFSLIISEFKATAYNVIPSVWEAIKGEVSSSLYEGVLVKPDLAKQIVFLAGVSKVITEIEETFRDLVENTTRRIERQNQSVEMSEPLAPAFYEIMCKSGQMDNIQSQLQYLKIEYEEATKTIKLCGLQEEVLSAKYEILSITQQLKSKSIPLDPHIIQFLGFNDNDLLSCMLFASHNINAIFRVEDNKVMLTGSSEKDLTEAEEQMRSELLCKKVVVEDKQILLNPLWESHKRHLLAIFTDDKCTIMIEDFVIGAENEVVIAGLAFSVEKAYQQIFDFVGNAIVQVIEVQSLVLIHCIKAEERHLFREIANLNVSVSTEGKTITLRGLSPHVKEAADLIQKSLSSFHLEVLHINKPGAKTFYREREEMFVSEAMNTFQCWFHLQEDEEDITTTSQEDLMEPHCQIDLPVGVTIAVYKDDLTRHHVDVVVNEVNKNLRLTEGLSLALNQAAGPRLQAEWDHIIQTEGRLTTGDSVITGAGYLPCKQVVHTMSRQWDPNSQTACRRLLQRAIKRCLDLAAENGHGSIGIPAVGSLMSGFPVNVSVQCIVGSLRQYVESSERAEKVTRIHLVDSADDTVAAFTEAVRAEFVDNVLNTSPTDNKAEHSESNESPTRSDGQMATTKVGLNSTTSNVYFPEIYGFGGRCC
ncbi:hypothetical protein XELAEV_18014022mg [Xenopus laevis]|uniref:Uncharacterized protein n=1 Tax=Xenopus laevis TaxID=8355 RepID=A0A974I050_XENLA|nr:hypothetical protein XELAEV_18014022mg [Xenopus laevis]